MTALIVVLLAAGSFAPLSQRPDLSGTYVMVSPAEAAGQEVIVKQDAATFSVKGGGSQDQEFVYHLDGSETRTALIDSDAVMVSTANWTETGLVITSTTTSRTEGRMDQRDTCSIDGEGHLHAEILIGPPSETPVVRSMTYRKR